MAEYSIWVLPESSISLTNGTVLDGVTQGDGSHLVGETLTITQSNSVEVFVSDPGMETNFSDNEGGQVLNGTQTFDGVTYADGTRIVAEYEFILRDEATGTEYRVLGVNIFNSNPTYSTIEGLGFVGSVPPVGVPLTIVSAQEGPPNGGVGAVDAAQIVPLCFCRGTKILTDQGDVAVEDLHEGQIVLRADGSKAQLRQILSTSVGAEALMANPKLRPVRIMAGALGLGLPKRDLLVSRQHRIMVRSRIVQRMFGQEEVLIPAIKLCELPGIFEDSSLCEVQYFHLLFDNHEVIMAEGAPTESLFLGSEALKAMGAEAREELLTLFPDLETWDNPPEMTRFIPAGRLQKQLVKRHLKNGKPLLNTARM